MALKEDKETSRFLTAALLDEYPYYSEDEEFQIFMDNQEKFEGVTWCEDKIAVKEFNIYRLTDFYMLWLIYLLGAFFSLTFKGGLL